jgi:hypothetical protein
MFYIIITRWSGSQKFDCSGPDEHNSNLKMKDILINQESQTIPYDWGKNP